MRSRYSPAVLRLAQEHDIDLSLVTGTGRGGRITRKDLERLIKEGTVPEKEVLPEVTETPSVAEQPSTSAVMPEALAEDKEIPVQGVRKAIAENMVRSKTEIPQDRKSTRLNSSHVAISYAV